MKKLQSAALTGLIILLVAAGAHAVTWDAPPPALYPTPAGIYAIPATMNGGFYWYSTTYSNFANSGSGSSFNNSDLHTQNIPASNHTAEDFGSNPGLLNFWAEAAGGVRSDGLFSSGYAEITHSGLTGNNGVSNGHQRIVSDTYRNFIPEGYGTITISADLSGYTQWETLNYDWTTNTVGNDLLPYSGYRLKGTVSLTINSASQGIQVGSLDPIELDNATLSGGFSFDPEADPDLYYLLHVSLLIDTYIQNTDPMFGPWWEPASELPSELRIGTDIAPMELSAAVTQSPVPIPGSLILLASGLAGLVIRRKVSKS